MTIWIFLFVFVLILLIVSEINRHLQKKTIYELTKQIENIYANFGTNELLKIQSQSKNKVAFVTALNQLLRRYKKEQQYYAKREKDLRKEMTNISHDLRTPLTSIKGFTELLQSKRFSPNEEQEYLDIIYKKVALLTKLTESFYVISQVESDDYPIQTEKLDLNQLVIDLMMSFFDEFNKASLTVSIDETNLPEISVDLKATSRIFTNLIQNAVRYAKNYFRVTFAEDERFVILTFANDVYDFDETQLTAIFKRSFSMDTSRSKGETGLGLYIVKKLVEKQQGKVKAAVNDNEFSLSLYFLK
ncbi:MAG: HAMP domain-containing histidine kinase [Tetragenococcus koreensis]|nr:HAMP domain-containing histidine kinase [Atopostipes sp.]MDN6268109.1 HAMP domain-containing histidine kinase [Tetragenococcus koreensis]MDN6733926.1 HAMP domain-containing histidine kinase [Tetragenococcus koreensis]MDN6735786.1 HAMP domain-containing histidine kinase [Tetragenococcus koreensis]MDN6749652.1 HAMP domain-containing histidine kinase [Staphylococcus equorum]